jgi:hypothetical protein
MTRKHFKSIAEVIKNTNLNNEQKKDLAEQFALMCNRFNSNFKWKTFINACGIRVKK